MDDNKPLPPIKRLTMDEAHYIDHVCRVEVEVIGRILRQSLLVPFDSSTTNKKKSWLGRIFMLNKEQTFTEKKLEDVQKLINHCTDFISLVMMLTSIIRRIEMEGAASEKVGKLEERYKVICDEIEALYALITKTDYGRNRYIIGALWQINHLYHEALRP